MIHRFGIDFVTDCNDILWSHNDQYIAVCNNCLQYKFVIYTPRGRKITQYSAYDNQLGIKSMNWSFNDQFIAVGSYDDTVRVFNTMTWRIVSQFKCDKKLNENLNYQLKSTIIYQETYDDEKEREQENAKEKEKQKQKQEKYNEKQKQKQLIQNEKQRQQHQQQQNYGNYGYKSAENKENSNNNGKNKNRFGDRNLIGWNKKDTMKQQQQQQQKHGKTCYVLRDMPFEILCKKNGNLSNSKIKPFKNSNNNNTNNNNKSGLLNFDIGFGISQCLWSNDNRFLCVQCDKMANVLWVWDMKYLVFHSILINIDNIKQFSWNNLNNRIECAISCNNDNLYLWSKKGCVVIRTIASRFNVKRLSWKPNSFDIQNKGSNKQKKHKNSDNDNEKSNEFEYQYNSAQNGCIALVDRDHFCCCYDLNF